MTDSKAYSDSRAPSQNPHCVSAERHPRKSVYDKSSFADSSLRPQDRLERFRKRGPTRHSQGVFRLRLP